MSRLAKDPDRVVRGALPGVVYNLVTMAMRVLRGMYGREAESHRATPDL